MESTELNRILTAINALTDAVDRLTIATLRGDVGTTPATSLATSLKTIEEARVVWTDHAAQ